jgi:hypothetical protein
MLYWTTWIVRQVTEKAEIDHILAVLAVVVTKAAGQRSFYC